MLEILPFGEYRTPPVGAESPIQAAETRLVVDHTGISVKSPLWPEPYTIGDHATFKDPRTELFLDAAIKQQFHHFTTRQLSLPEIYETRPGASRFVRLGGLLDSAKMLEDLGATFEQIFQTTISDLAFPAGSHLRGDYLLGDYVDQDTHDSDLIQYLARSGFILHLMGIGIIEQGGNLAGSDVTWAELADPRLPRRHDIVECPRPDGNADRNQFTLHEGVIIHDQSEIQEAAKSFVRVETADGERIAMSKIDAGRLLFRLAIRHQSEHWGDPVRRVVEELVLLPERIIFSTSQPFGRHMQSKYPVDFARTDELSWYEKLYDITENVPYLEKVLEIASSIAAQQRDVAINYIGNDSYKGPVSPEGVELVVVQDLPPKPLYIEGDTLILALPRPKYRGPIESLVVTKNGLQRTGRNYPDLAAFEDSRRAWTQSHYVAKVKISNGHARDLQPIVDELLINWFDENLKPMKKHPSDRPGMSKNQLTRQLEIARKKVMKAANIG